MLTSFNPQYWLKTLNRYDDGSAARSTNSKLTVLQALEVLGQAPGLAEALELLERLPVLMKGKQGSVQVPLPANVVVTLQAGTKGYDNLSSAVRASYTLKGKSIDHDAVLLALPYTTPKSFAGYIQSGLKCPAAPIDRAALMKNAATLDEAIEVGVLTWRQREMLIHGIVDILVKRSSKNMLRRALNSYADNKKQTARAAEPQRESSLLAQAKAAQELIDAIPA